MDRTSHTETGSPLLRALQHDVWAGLLLPLLMAQKSAGEVTLTCTALRTLCQRHQQQLNLSSLAGVKETTTAQAQAEALAQHFPSCSRVKLYITSNQNIMTAPYILGGLGRLTGLHELDLSISGKPNVVGTAMVLMSINQKLKGLKRLLLTPHMSLAGKSLIWQQLGKATQLTGLQVQFAGQGTSDICCLQDVAWLKSLSRLQHLSIPPPMLQDSQEANQTPDMSFLGHMTSLTHLHMPVFKAKGLDNISRCCKLQELWLRRPGYSVPVAEWAGVAQLTALTGLYVGSTLTSGSTDAFYNALSNLKHLHWVAAMDAWTPAVLVAFSGLAKLWSVQGPWQDAPAAQPVAEADQDSTATDGITTCPSITQLERGGGWAPFQAFPNLVNLFITSSMDPSTLVALCDSCKQLRKLGTQVPSAAKIDWTTLAHAREGIPGASAAHVAAVGKLAQLTNLSSLAFQAETNQEVAALASAIPSVRSLQLVFSTGQRRHAPLLPMGWLRSRGVEADCGGLMLLARCTLSKLSVVFQGVLVPQDAAQMLLCGLSHIPEVWVGVGCDTYTASATMAAFQAAEAHSLTLGLGVPQKLTVHMWPALKPSAVGDCVKAA